MFDSMTFGQRYSSKEYKKVEGELQMKLFNLQNACEENKLSVLITLAGVDGAGRGDVVNTLSSWLDIKKIRNHTFWNPSDEEKSRPEAWRYWMCLPKTGEVAIFFNGWYGSLMQKIMKDHISENEIFQALRSKVDLERTLSNNGTINIKLWLHLGEKEYLKRLKERKENKLAFEFNPHEDTVNISYKEFISTAEKVIHSTDSEFAPWCIIDAENKNFRNITIAKNLIENIEHALNKHIAMKSQQEVPFTDFTDESMGVLDKLDLSKDLTRVEYKKELSMLQKEVSQLSFKAYQKGISSTLLFEGWDAGGKGGAIRRIASAVDARITRIIPISSPTDEELAHHYLWRFWRHVPRAGYLTIYDRTWYGRVLVERIEGYAKTAEWKRAFAEINAFENELVDNKNILLKFWLHISPEEQLARFQSREETPWKNYKITEEDWRNRAKTPEYKVAADEMFMRTNTEQAPWHIIPAESKMYARVKVLRIYRDALQKAIKEIDKKEAIKMTDSEDIKTKENKKSKNKNKI